MKPFKEARSAVSVTGSETANKVDPYYSVLSSFYQMIIITSIHFTVLLLAFYLD